MEIRNALEADREEIREVHVASIRKLCRRHYAPEQVAAWTDILVPSVYDQALREKEFLVACDAQGHLLGLGILDLENTEISAIYIHPDHTGKGVGSALLYAFEQMARHKDKLEIVVHSTLNAKGFYKAHGYTEQESAFHELPNGLRLECIRMVKILRRK